MVNLDRAGRQFDGLPVARQVIGTLALDLDGGVLRRDLLDQAGEPRQQLGNRFRGGPFITRFDDPAFGIVGIAFLAPGDRKAVALAAVHHERNRLGGFAQRNRQSAGGERIERAGVAGALGLEQPLHDRDRMRRGHADRLVEHDPAVDVALVAARLVVRARLLARARRLLVAMSSHRDSSHRDLHPKKYFFSRRPNRRFAARSGCLRWSQSSAFVLVWCEVSLHRRCSQ